MEFVYIKNKQVIRSYFDFFIFILLRRCVFLSSFPVDYDLCTGSKPGIFHPEPQLNVKYVPTQVVYVWARTCVVGGGGCVFVITIEQTLS